jgi:predicted TIM-barrel fold metal-dependent hydrolase
MWASDYPVLEFARCREQIAAMPIRDEERRRAFAHDNAQRVLFAAAEGSQS